MTRTLILPSSGSIFRSFIARARPVSGRFKLSPTDWLDAEFKRDIFEAKGVKPLYFSGGSNHYFRQTCCVWDQIKYWPQHHWIAFWVMFAVGIVAICKDSAGTSILSRYRNATDLPPTPGARRPVERSWYRDRYRPPADRPDGPVRRRTRRGRRGGSRCRRSCHRPAGAG